MPKKVYIVTEIFKTLGHFYTKLKTVLCFHFWLFFFGIMQI